MVMVMIRRRRSVVVVVRIRTRISRSESLPSVRVVHHHGGSREFFVRVVYVLKRHRCEEEEGDARVYLHENNERTNVLMRMVFSL